MANSVDLFFLTLLASDLPSFLIFPFFTAPFFILPFCGLYFVTGVAGLDSVDVGEEEREMPGTDTGLGAVLGTLPSSAWESGLSGLVATEKREMADAGRERDAGPGPGWAGLEALAGRGRSSSLMLAW